MANLVSQFTSSIRTGVAPLSVNFTNTSTGPYSSVRWEFGDTEQSTLINPTHQYLNDGVFQVTLTIYSDDSRMDSSTSTITVFADDSGSPSATTQQALFTSKRFQLGQVAVRKTIVDGSVLETEFPLSSETGGFATNVVSFIEPMILYKSGATIAGNEIVVVDADHTTFYPFLDAGYEAYIGLFIHTGATLHVDSGATEESSGHSLYMYKVESYNQGNDQVILDRATPIISGNNAIEFRGFAVLSWTGQTNLGVFYPNSGYKSLQSTQTIDGLNTLNFPGMYTPDQAGVGLQKYVEIDNNSGSTKMMIQPTWSGWNTVEMWKPGTTRLSLPYVMWHTRDIPGVTLTDSTTTYRDAETNLQYSYLTIENEGSNVGRVFHEKKLVVLDDIELQASLMFLSNRNWTLPKMITSETSEEDTTGGFETGVTYWMTYSVADARDDKYVDGLAIGNGDIRSLHCRYLTEYSPTVDGNKCRIQAAQSNWHAPDRTSWEDSGFTCTAFTLYIASATTGDPLSAATWYFADTYSAMNITSLYTGTSVIYSGEQEAKNPVGFNLQTTQTLQPNAFSGSSTLMYGQDPFVLGYFTATSQSTIYKMSTTCVAKNGEFNVTQNDTFDESLNESVYISEVALYNENNELLMTGKLNTPVEKNDKKFVTIKMELDL